MPPYPTLLALQFATGCLSAPLLSQLAVYIDVLHWSPLFTASLQTAQMLLGAITSIGGGLLADLVGVRRAYLLGLLGAVLLALVFLTAEPALMLLLALAGGAAIGTQYVASQAYLLAARGRSRIGLGAAVFFLGNTLGSSLGNLVAGRAIVQLGFPPVMATIAAASLALLAAAALVLPALPTAASRQRPLSILRGYGRLLRQRPVAVLCAVRYLTTCYWGAATLLLPLLLHRLTGSAAVAGAYAALSLAVAAVASVAVGRLWDRLQSRWIAPALIATVAVDGLLLAAVARNVTGLFLAGTLGAAAAWSLSALMPGLIGSLAVDTERGRGVGLLQSAWSIGMLSGALLAGGLVEIAPSLPFLASAGLVVVALLLMLRLRGVAHPAAVVRG
ncbi:MAG: MFS transporter [Candidatus Dormiibacterota bacterium]